MKKYLQFLKEISCFLLSIIFLISTFGCSSSDPAQIYERAKKSISEGDTTKADELVAKVEEARISELKNAQVGDIIFYGFYEQDNDFDNGKEEIEWEVLAKEEDRILVISKLVLDAQPYNEKFEAVTWETCSLRMWLNSSFLNEAFSAELQKHIIMGDVTAGRHTLYEEIEKIDPGSDTVDQIFVLSMEEIETYYGWINDRMPERSINATNYAIAQGVKIEHREYVNDFWALEVEGIEMEYGKTVWWMRGVGIKPYLAIVMMPSGRVGSEGMMVYCDNVGVRPAMWISTKE